MIYFKNLLYVVLQKVIVRKFLFRLKNNNLKNNIEDNTTQLIFQADTKIG